MKLDIIYEDEDIIVCYKPAGVPTQTKRLGQQDMETLLKNYRARKKEEPYIAVLHRLDQPVEGVMVFAKNQKAAKSLSKQISSRQIGKHYYAVAAKSESAQPLEQKGTFEDYMTFDKRTNVGKITDKNASQAKSAKLDYEIINTKLIEKEDGTVIEEYVFDITLHTGRHHQIRLQFASRGYALIGDHKYGDETSKIRRNVALCSYRLQFEHPTTKKQMDFKIEPRNAAYAAGAKYR